MMPADGLPEAGDLAFKDARDEERRFHLRRIGVSSQGVVYRNEDGADYFRLIPVRRRPSSGSPRSRRSDEAPIERRHEIRRWISSKAAPQDSGAPAWVGSPETYNLAPIVQVEMGRIAETPVLFVRYGLRSALSLSEALADPDTLTRIDRAIHLLRALPVWKLRLYDGLLPMPSDIVFTDKGLPFILPVPSWRHPDIESIFSAPDRARYLAPEYVRGTPEPSLDRNMDTYAVGAILMQCFHGAPPLADAGSALTRAANSSIWNDAPIELPFWMQSLPPTREAIAAVRRMIDPDPRVRAGVEMLEMADRLAGWRNRMTPRAAANELIREKRFQEAYLLLQDVLLTEESRAGSGKGASELLLLAARAARSADRALEAVDLLEKAIAKAPEQSEAYEEQLDLLLSPAVQSVLHVLAGNRGDPGPQVEACVWRDFERIERHRRDDRIELAVARFLSGRPDVRKAANFIYSLLFDAEGTFLWWKFPIWLLYVDVLFRLGEPRLAGGELNKLIKQLAEAKAGERVKESEMAGYRQEIERLMVQIGRALGQAVKPSGS